MNDRQNEMEQTRNTVKYIVSLQKGAFVSGGFMHVHHIPEAKIFGGISQL